MAAPSEVCLSFHNIQYSVQLKDGTKKTILHGPSGYACTNRFTAIMGPSGAGKSTLLDTLAAAQAGRGGKYSGEVHINGSARDEKQFRQMSCYVMQRDVLLESATVREALMTSALLQLPMGMSATEKAARVDAVLDMLELRHCADTLIGDEVMGIKGISGGEKRRVSLGVELVRNPRIIFLDEPTTGLDSEMALGVIQCVSRLAHKGRLVMATIHQPNSDITELFDDFMLLAKGRMLYCGAWRDAVPYFAGLSYACPQFKNPTDYFLSIASDQPTLEWLGKEQGKHWAGVSSARVAAINDNIRRTGYICIEDACGNPSKAADSHAMQVVVLADGKQPPAAELSPSSSELDLQEVPAGPKVPAYYQMWVLAQRFFRSWARHPMLLASELGQFLFIALFLGLTFLRLSSSSATAVQDRVSSLFFILAALVYIPSFTIIVVWDKEKLLLAREAGNGAYRPSSFFIAKTLTSSPILVLEALVFSAILYFMIGYQATLTKFAAFAATQVIFALASETVGFLCALAAPESKVGIILVTLVLVILMSFSGFLVAAPPVYFSWIGKASFFSYAQAALIKNEFQGLKLWQGGKMVKDAYTLLPSAVKNDLSVWANIGVVAAATLGMRLAAFLWLEIRYRVGTRK